MTLVITVFCREENRAEGTFSATTAISGILTFTLGAYAVVGDERIAAAAAVAATGLLAIREELHGSGREDHLAGVALRPATARHDLHASPIMPGNPIGPFRGINPREVWIIAIVLAACLSWATSTITRSPRQPWRTACRRRWRARIVNRGYRGERAAHGRPRRLRPILEAFLYATAASLLCSRSPRDRPKRLHVTGPTLDRRGYGGERHRLTHPFWL